MRFYKVVFLSKGTSNPYSLIFSDLSSGEDRRFFRLAQYNPLRFDEVSPGHVSADILTGKIRPVGSHEMREHPLNHYLIRYVQDTALTLYDIDANKVYHLLRSWIEQTHDEKTPDILHSWILSNLLTSKGMRQIAESNDFSMSVWAADLRHHVHEEIVVGVNIACTSEDIVLSKSLRGLVRIIVKRSVMPRFTLSPR